MLIDEYHETSTIQFYNKVSQTRKRRKTRTTFSNGQLNELENNFNRQRYLTPTDRDRIAKYLGLTNTQVITWFQNRRAKLKREAEELERDVMALRKQKQQKFTYLSLTDHDHDEAGIDDEQEQEDVEVHEDVRKEPNVEEVGAGGEENPHTNQHTNYLTPSSSTRSHIMIPSSSSSSLENFSSSLLNTKFTDNTHETLNMNMNNALLITKSLNPFTHESIINHHVQYENYAKNNSKQFTLLNPITNNLNHNHNHSNHVKKSSSIDDESHKGKTFKKTNKIWCPALELEQEIH
ncbi:unnamed protein product [Schistosoma turkestanicum]|nr:unnamed protein product [Schistosoma turkestanicum]